MAGEISVSRDIISEILKHLPVKTLMRMRCVSKVWCSIIDHDLSAIHSRHSRSHGRFTFVAAVYNSDTLSMVDPKTGQVTDILNLADIDDYTLLNLYDPFGFDERQLATPFQSVNGLFCTLNSILNPSRRESIALPPTHMGYVNDRNVPWAQTSCEFVAECCLGYDPSTNTYKVLNMFGLNIRSRDRKGYHWKIGDTNYKIMTLGKDHSWRDIDIDSDSDSVLHQLKRFSVRKICCVNGVIYCVGLINDSSESWYDRSNVGVIVAFEVRDEKFRVIPLPRIGIGSSNKPSVEHVLQVGEHLGLIDRNVREVWILKDDLNKQVWSRHTINLPSFYRTVARRKPSLVILTPIGSIHGDEILIKALSIEHPMVYPSELLYYSLESKEITWMCKLSEHFDLTPHVESVFTFKGLGKKEEEEDDNKGKPAVKEFFI